jgi:hypothetical protein
VVEGPQELESDNNIEFIYFLFIIHLRKEEGKVKRRASFMLKNTQFVYETEFCVSNLCSNKIN